MCTSRVYELWVGPKRAPEAQLSRKEDQHGDSGRPFCWDAFFFVNRCLVGPFSVNMFFQSFFDMVCNAKVNVSQEMRTGSEFCDGMIEQAQRIQATRLIFHIQISDALLCPSQPSSQTAINKIEFRQVGFFS